MPEPSMTSEQPPARWRVLAAFAAIYLIWGSSYIAIHFAIQTIPPFLMASVRFLTAGAALYFWMCSRGVAAPSARQWGAAAVAGLLMFGINNGSLVWAQQTVPSGTAALMIGTTPLFMALFDWLRPGGKRPTALVFVGLVVGVAGIGLLVNPGQPTTGGPTMWLGVAALVMASIAWSAGSIYNRHAHLPANAMMSTALQLVTGGAVLGLIALVSGEVGTFDASAVSTTSLLALVYLGTFSSIIGFGSYIWLLRVSTPTRVSTYAYVNPVVAVFLGWLLANETVSERTLLAAAIIIASIMLINGERARAGMRRSVPEPVINVPADGATIP